MSNKRRTTFIVYVDKAVMSNPEELFQAVFAYFVKKDMKLDKRKLFMAEFIRAITEEDQLAVMDKWVQVRDAATFPYRRSLDEGKEVEGGVSVDSNAEPESGDAPE